MEVDGFDGDVVNLGFGRAQGFEDCGGGLLGLGADRAGSDQRFYFAEMAAVRVDERG